MLIIAVKATALTAAAQPRQVAHRRRTRSSSRCSTASRGGSSKACNSSPSIPTASSPPPCRSSRSSAAWSTRRAADPTAGTVIVNHADKLIIGEPGGETERALGAAVRRCSTAPDFVPTSPATSAGRSGTSCGAMRRSTRCRRWSARPATGSSPMPNAARGCSKAWRSWRAIGAAIGCPISESGEDRMAVTAAARRVQDVDAAGRRGRPADRARGAARRASREFARRARHPDARARPALRRYAS